LKIKVVHFGKISRNELVFVGKDLQKRIGSFCKFEDQELKFSAKKPDKRTTAKTEQAPLYSPSKGEYVVFLDERGVSCRSVDFSQKLQAWIDNPQIKQVTFVVGPPYGFDQESKKIADELWSLSKLTLPSDYAWMLVWEQIYRGLSIIHNLPYHHD
jgi:23S rRNA (pseudouridine1915-N3)-methyltransferase